MYRMGSHVVGIEPVASWDGLRSLGSLALKVADYMQIHLIKNDVDHLIIAEIRRFGWH